MSKQSETKLGEVFPRLKGVNMDIEELDLSVRSYNMIKLLGVNDLRGLLEVSEHDLMYAGSVPKSPMEILLKLRELSDR